MGLDVFIKPGLHKYPSAEDVAAFAALGDLPLAGWMAEGSLIAFRGKVYEDFVFRVCMNSLYQEWIPPREVAQMAQAIEALDYESELVKELLEATRVPESHARALGEVLKLCAKRRLGLHGDW